jgi:hypothetical protein
MKKLLIFISVIGLTVMSCKKPGCTDLTATNFNNEATEDDGTCTYPEPDPRLPVLGYYLVKDSLFVNGNFMGLKTYTLQVSKDNGNISDVIFFNNLWGTDNVYNSTVNNYQVLTPSQKIDPDSSQLFTGTGFFYADYISLTNNYTLIVGEDTNQVKVKTFGDK